MIKQEINNIVFNYLKNNNGEINYKNNEIKFIFGLLIKNNFDNKYLNFIGKISFELYMIHGLFMAIFGKYFVSSTINDIVYTALVLIFSISFAWFINQLLKKISL